LTTRRDDRKLIKSPRRLPNPRPIWRHRGPVSCWRTAPDFQPTPDHTGALLAWFFLQPYADISLIIGCAYLVTRTWRSAPVALENHCTHGARSLLRADVRGVQARGRSGVSRMCSLRHSRNWTRSSSLRRPRNWGSFWKLGSRNRSSLGRYRPGRRSFITSFCPAGVARGPTLRPTHRFLRSPFNGQSRDGRRLGS
jgi:hypothetical protein